MRRSTSLFQVLMVFTTMVETQWSSVSGTYCKDMASSVYRPHSVTITEFGAVGDGGISEVRAEGLRISNSMHGIRIKTAPGRGGYVKNVYIAGVSMDNVSMALRITGNFGEHPDDKYDRNALPMISNITIENVVGVNVGVAGILEGIEGDNFSSICLSNPYH
ncbi:hypothetical protein ABZP36_019284 [Zizania latifolia]